MAMRRCVDQRGQSLVELALALPVVLAVVGAIIDGGWAFHQAGMVVAAAQAAQRAVAVQDTGAANCSGAPPGSYAQAARAAATAAAPELNPDVLAVEVEYLDAACTGRMRTLSVTAAYPLTALTPWFAPLLNGRRVTGQASSAVEEVPPPWWGQGDRIQAQQAEIASLTAAYQAEVAQAAAFARAASYYYTLWQSARPPRDGADDH